MSFVPEAVSRLFAGRNRAPVQLNEKGSRTGALVAFEQLGEPVWSPRDYGAFAREGFMQNAILYRSVRMIAEAAASIPLLLYEGDEEIEDHPLLDLLRQPSLDHKTIDFLESWYGFLLVAGNAYVEAVAIDGEVRELHVLRPDRMKVIPGPDGWPEGYEYTAGGQSIRFMDDAVPGVRPILHTRMFHPANDHYGFSPIEAASVAIDIHNEASKWNKALLDNSARPSGALVYAAANGQMTGEQFQRLKDELETSYQGARHAGRPLLLEGGLDWKPLSLSPKDMDFIEAKNSAAREIALAMGVPPQLLGIPGDSTYSNYAEAQRAFWRQTVLPLVNRMTRAFGGWLVPVLHPDTSGRFAERMPRGTARLELRPDLDQVEALTPERERLWSRLNAAKFLTDDEKRAAAGYGPKDPQEAAQKYREDQPRVPSGNGRESGRWTDEGGSGAGDGSQQEHQEAGLRDRLGKLLQSVLKSPKSSTKLPDFLQKRPGPGKISGDIKPLSKAEREFAEEMRDLGNDIEIVPRGVDRTPDFKINGVSHELKTVTNIVKSDADSLSGSISTTIMNARSQSPRIIIDARGQAGMTKEAAEQAAKRAYGADFKKSIESITILTPDGPFYAPRIN